jgi:hypothetical protein
MTHPMVTWGEVQCAFISRFSEMHSEGQAITTLKYTKQKKYEYVEYYYDKFLRLCIVIPQRPHDIYLRKAFREGLRAKVKMAITSMREKLWYK